VFTFQAVKSAVWQRWRRPGWAGQGFGDLGKRGAAAWIPRILWPRPPSAVKTGPLGRWPVRKMWPCSTAHYDDKEVEGCRPLSCRQKLAASWLPHCPTWSTTSGIHPPPDTTAGERGPWGGGGWRKGVELEACGPSRFQQPWPTTRSGPIEKKSGGE